MSREIKFDCVVKDASGNLGYLPYSIRDLQQGVTPQRNTAVQEIVAWREYTGLKDKNGREIYEGDIVRYVHTNGHIDKHVGTKAVEWLNHNNGVGFNISARSRNGGQVDVRWEVIGNIYENPELLEVGDAKD